MLGVFLSSVSQIFFKKSADKTGKETSFSKQYLNVYVIAGYFLLFLSMLIPLYVLRFIELKYVAVIESLAYVFVMLLSTVFLKEKITKRMFFGNALIILGVIVFGLKF